MKFFDVFLSNPFHSEKYNENFFLTEEMCSLFPEISDKVAEKRIKAPRPAVLNLFIVSIKFIGFLD